MSEMRLSSVSFENYRGFLNHCELELRPLTLLFGYNSAGKSSALRLLPILSESGAMERYEPLALDSPAARGGSFRDLLPRQASSPTLQLGLGFKSLNSEEVTLKYWIRDFAERQAQAVEKFEVTSLNRQQSISAIWDAKSDDLFARVRSYEFQLNGKPSGTFPVSFNGLIFDRRRTGKHLLSVGL